MVLSRLDGVSVVVSLSGAPRYSCATVLRARQPSVIKAKLPVPSCLCCRFDCELPRSKNARRAYVDRPMLSLDKVPATGMKYEDMSSEFGHWSSTHHSEVFSAAQCSELETPPRKAAAEALSAMTPDEKPSWVGTRAEVQLAAEVPLAADAIDSETAMDCAASCVNLAGVPLPLVRPPTHAHCHRARVQQPPPRPTPGFQDVLIGGVWQLRPRQLDDGTIG